MASMLSASRPSVGKVPSVGRRCKLLRRPCVIADGRVLHNGKESCGTSFAAPRVANLACFIFDAILQVHRVLCFVKSPDEALGVPIVGWGMIDKADGANIGLSRENLNAMPFLGVKEASLTKAFRSLLSRGIDVWMTIHAIPVRTILLRAAKSIPNRETHEIGSGFISEQIVLDYLEKMSFSELLDLFCDDLAERGINKGFENVKVFDRDELVELLAIARRARPIWTYDYLTPKFFVNSPFGEKAIVVGDLSHALKVALAGI